MLDENELIRNLDKLHTTKLGVKRIKQNLGLETDDVVDWCKQKIVQSGEIIKTGKNWYVHTNDCVIAVNANSYTIITAHKIKKNGIDIVELTQANLEEAYDVFLSMIHKLEKTQEKIKPDTPQWTTIIKRLKALRLALSFINRELKKY